MVTKKSVKRGVDIDTVTKNPKKVAWTWTRTHNFSKIVAWTWTPSISKTGVHLTLVYIFINSTVAGLNLGEFKF